MKWHRRNKLALQFLHLNELKDVSGLAVADADSFRDHKITLNALSLFGVYLVVGTISYDLYFRDCAKMGAEDPDGVQSHRLTNSTLNFVSNNLNDVSNAGENMQQFGAEMLDANCKRGGVSWQSFLDAMVFQFTSFTTVGFGTHPKNFVDDQSQVRADGACCPDLFSILFVC